MTGRQLASVQVLPEGRKWSFRTPEGWVDAGASRGPYMYQSIIIQLSWSYNINYAKIMADHISQNHIIRDVMNDEKISGDLYKSNIINHQPASLGSACRNGPELGQHRV